jgi:2-oxoglutarate ferredoxin oxidoreductase subunit gamma
VSTEIRIAGVGSQGLVTASIILAEALGIIRDFEVIQTQFYASNIQGGSSCGDVIFGREKIVFPWVLKPDYLVALAQDGIRTHGAAMRPGSIVLADELMVSDVSKLAPGVTIYRAPLTELADSLGVRKCTNIVALGALARLTGLLSLEQIAQAVQARAPGKPDINKQAVRLGYNAVLRLNSEIQPAAALA